MAEITLTTEQLSNLLKNAVQTGVAQYIRETEPSRDMLSQREAYKLFGEARVKRWVVVGHITPRRAGGARNSKLCYSYAELLLADKTERSNPIVNK